MKRFKNSKGYLFMMICLVVGFLTIPAQAATEEDIETSIDAGIVWLASAQNPDGSWGGYERVAHTGFAVMKLEDRAFELGYDSPFDLLYPYHQNVIDGLNYIFENAHTIIISPQSAGDPDGNSNGIGVFISDANHPTYATSIALMAIAGSRDPSRVVTTGSLSSWTYGDVVQDAVDYLAFGQNDVGATRGGWGYMENQQWSDNSNSGYAVLGLDFAESAMFGFNVVVPQFVKEELNIWIDYIQNDANGGSGYSSPNSWVNVLKTGNLIYQMAFYGDEADAPRVIAAINYIESQWNANNSDPGFRPHHYQAMYCMMKGFERMGIEIINVGGDIDWFDEVSTIIVNSQIGDGSWPSDSWGDNILSAGWALLTLERVVPPHNIFVYVDIKPESCPNPLNPKDKGVFPIAILGTEDFDVSTIDPNTVQLEGVSPLRWSLEDVATPFDGEECECTTEGPDGFMDLTLKFNTQELIGVLGVVTDGEVRPLYLTGNLMEEFGGTVIEGSDCVIMRVKLKKQSAANLGDLPEEYALFDNFPNPFNPSTTINYSIPEDSYVTLSIYDVLGNEVAQLESGYKSAGNYSYLFDATDLTSGIFFYTIRSGKFTETKKMLLMK